MIVDEHDAIERMHEFEVYEHAVGVARDRSILQTNRTTYNGNTYAKFYYNFKSDGEFYLSKR